MATIFKGFPHNDDCLCLRPEEPSNVTTVASNTHDNSVYIIYEIAAATANKIYLSTLYSTMLR